MDRGAWWAAVHGVAESWERLSDLTFTFHFHALEKEMATHSSVLASRIPGTGEPGGLPSMGSHRVGHDRSDSSSSSSFLSISLVNTLLSYLYKDIWVLNISNSTKTSWQEKTPMFIFYSSASSQSVSLCVLRCSVIADFFATPWTVAHQAPLSMGFPCKNTAVG